MLTRKSLAAIALLIASQTSMTAQGACSKWGPWCDATRITVIEPCSGGTMVIMEESSLGECHLQRRRCKDTGSNEEEWRKNPNVTPPCSHHTVVKTVTCP